MRTRLSCPLLVLIASLAIAGCGGGSDSKSSDTGGGSSTRTDTSNASPNSSKQSEGTSGAGATDASDASADAGTTLRLGAKGNELKFDKDELTAPAGKVTLEFTNDSSIPHNIALEMDGDDSEGEIVTNGKVSRITVEVEKGTYTYYCTPHKSAGMTGTLTVT